MKYTKGFACFADGISSLWLCITCRSFGVVFGVYETFLVLCLWCINCAWSGSLGLRRLFGEDLVIFRWASSHNVAGSLGWDLRPGRKLREHSDCGGQLRQDHSRVVPSDLCPRGRAAGAHRLHYLATGTPHLPSLSDSCPVILLPAWPIKPKNIKGFCLICLC